jgi:hypothetical protein
MNPYHVMYDPITGEIYLAPLSNDGEIIPLKIHMGYIEKALSVDQVRTRMAEEGIAQLECEEEEMESWEQDPDWWKV